ncbi:hypothetical protein FJZ18_01235 [Candidatus Pacearchaeota archaeon]|nr:hypothetical protein [Candidatus Pacearchaeota archaeon]
MNDVVYHASPKQGLGVINPLSDNKNGRKVVCASKDEVIASLFLGRTGGDYTCCLGREIIFNIPYLVERFPGAFRLKYNIPASLYELPSSTFFNDGSTWDDEVISHEPVKPVRENKIVNAGEHLLHLETQGKLHIYLYLHRIAAIPDDDSDLVEKSLMWAKSKGLDEVLKQVRRFHPGLVDRIKQEWIALKKIKLFSLKPGFLHKNKKASAEN